MFSRLRHQIRNRLARLDCPGWLLPSSCALCGLEGVASVCAACHAQYFGGGNLRCACCALALADDGAARAGTKPSCGDCLVHPPAFDATLVATDYSAPADQMVLNLKFGARLALAPAIARLLAEAIRLDPHWIPPQVLTAVPLGGERLAQRGFNQALEVARPLSRTLDLPLDAMLAVRQRETGAQSLLQHGTRHDNMRGAFTVPAIALERVRGKHIGVIDDVITSGATLGELAATLKRFGATRVTNIVFARTRLH